ncbi:unnamed protein product [Nippostrongylus brasiliensis]|uniref:Bet_v_1 domain-containing protein n=1 Tax=Nippostrongylus brasiliensis TaxID=27835 RepID=A0A0N4XZV6_NIPBR|nr:unnamed protein product [Nippostrongylus brasiliensis]
MAETCSQDLVTPFLSKILGPMEVLRTNLKCDKQTDGNYLYEYTVQVHPKEEDEGLAGQYAFIMTFLGNWRYV